MESEGIRFLYDHAEFWHGHMTPWFDPAGWMLEHSGPWGWDLVLVLQPLWCRVTRVQDSESFAWRGIAPSGSPAWKWKPFAGDAVRAPSHGYEPPPFRLADDSYMASGPLIPAESSAVFFVIFFFFAEWIARIVISMYFLFQQMQLVLSKR